MTNEKKIVGRLPIVWLCFKREGERLVQCQQRGQWVEDAGRQRGQLVIIQVSERAITSAREQPVKASSLFVAPKMGTIAR